MTCFLACKEHDSWPLVKPGSASRAQSACKPAHSVLHQDTTFRVRLCCFPAGAHRASRGAASLLQKHTHCCGYIAVAALLWLPCYGYMLNRGHHAATAPPCPVTTHCCAACGSLGAQCCDEALARGAACARNLQCTPEDTCSPIPRALSSCLCVCCLWPPRLRALLLGSC